MTRTTLLLLVAGSSYHAMAEDQQSMEIELDEYDAALKELEEIEEEIEAEFGAEMTPESYDDGGSAGRRTLRSTTKEFADHFKMQKAIVMTDMPKSNEWDLETRQTIVSDNAFNPWVRYEGYSDKTWIQNWLPSPDSDVYKNVTAAGSVAVAAVSAFACNERLESSDDGKEVWDTDCCAYDPNDCKGDENSFYGSCVAGYTRSRGDRHCGHESLRTNLKICSTICTFNEKEHNIIQKVLDEIKAPLSKFTPISTLNQLIREMRTKRRELRRWKSRWLSIKNGDLEDEVEEEKSEIASLKQLFETKKAELEDEQNRLSPDWAREKLKSLNAVEFVTNSVVSEKKKEFDSAWFLLVKMKKGNLKDKLTRALKFVEKANDALDSWEPKLKERLEAMKYATVEEKFNQCQTDLSDAETELKNVIESKDNMFAALLTEKNACSASYEQLDEKYQTCSAEMDSAEGAIVDAIHFQNEYKFYEAREALLDSMKQTDDKDSIKPSLSRKEVRAFLGPKSSITRGIDSAFVCGQQNDSRLLSFVVKSLHDNSEEDSPDDSEILEIASGSVQNEFELVSVSINNEEGKKVEWIFDCDSASSRGETEVISIVNRSGKALSLSKLKIEKAERVTNWQCSGNRAYTLVTDERKSWSDAEDYCSNTFSAIDAHLATIENASQNRLLHSMMMGQRLAFRYWIGFNDIEEEGKWKWIDDEDVGMEYRNWMKENPNNFRNNQDCAMSYSDCTDNEHWKCEVTKWDDADCNVEETFACSVRLDKGFGSPTTSSSEESSESSSEGGEGSWFCNADDQTVYRIDDGKTFGGVVDVVTDVVDAVTEPVINADAPTEVTDEESTKSNRRLRGGH